MKTYAVTIPPHRVALYANAYDVPASEHLVGADDADGARVEAARRAHRDAEVPPFRSLTAQTAGHAHAVAHETPAAERARKMRERSA